MLTDSTLIAEDAALARTEWDETFDAAFDLVAGPDDCPDAFLSYVSEAYATDARQPEEWTDAEMAEAYRGLASALRSDYLDAERDGLRAVCEERAEWLALAAEAAPIHETAAPAERFALATEGQYASAASYRVHAREPHERFDRMRTEVIADGLTMAEAAALADRMRAEVPGLVYTVAAAPLAEQMAAAADALRERRGRLAVEGRARRDRLAVVPASPAERPESAPALSRAEAVEADAADVFAHVSACGCRFDVSAKLEQAEAFTLRRGGSSLAVPSKLRGTRGLAERVGTLAGDLESWDGGGSVYLPTVLHVLPEGVEGGPGVAVLAAPKGTRREAYLVGYLQDKHARWLAPLLNPSAAGTVTREGTPVRVYVTAVTGGTAEKPTRGVNVCITGAAEAVRRMWREAERAAAKEAAYESGSRAAVEALVE